MGTLQDQEKEGKPQPKQRKNKHVSTFNIENVSVKINRNILKCYLGQFKDKRGWKRM